MARVLLSLDLTPKTPADQQKLARALRVLAAENGDLQVRPGATPVTTVIGASSETHLEQIVDRLRREFEVEANLGKPRVAYLETLTRSAEGSAKHVRRTIGRGEYAHVCLRVYPLETAGGYRFADATMGGEIPKRFMASIDSGVREAMASGMLNGYPIVDVRVEVHGGSYHETDSSDEAFGRAAAMAFLEAAKQAQPLVLEPVMHVVVTAKNAYVNAVLDDLSVRRGEIAGRTQESDHEIITAHVPLSELFGCEGHLRIQTRGHASCSTRFAYYQPVVRGPAADDDHASRVGAPRRPRPNPRGSAASVAEPDDGDMKA